uniref:Uncharacterized protein n=1 Tax=Cyprinus carpio TaxID=7962 RepID=A0A8C1IGP3_CYPCA
KMLNIKEKTLLKLNIVYSCHKNEIITLLWPPVSFDHELPNEQHTRIQNFLHLTPVAIKKHCEALKQFCTEWPSALDSEEKCMKHFPIQVQSKEFTVRIVKLSSLNLDDHASSVKSNTKTEAWESVLDAVLHTLLRLKNEGETEENLQKYKEAVKKLFNIRGTKISSL